jgi:hypothetical protein
MAMPQFENSASLEARMETRASLLEKAERCFRLARAIDAPDVISKLLELARQYEAQAQNIETSSAARKTTDKNSN